MQRSFKVRADQRPRLCPTCPHGMRLSHPRWLTIWTSSCGFWPPPRMTVGLRSMILFHCGLWEIHSTWNRHEDIALSSWIIYKYPLSGSDGRVCLQCQRPGFDPWVRKIPWRRKWQPTPAFLPEEFHGQKSLVGYSPCGHKESDKTEWLAPSSSFSLQPIQTLLTFQSPVKGQRSPESLSPLL